MENLVKGKDMMDMFLGIVNTGVTIISIFVTIAGIVQSTKKEK